MSPVVTNQMVNGSLNLNGWKSWADGGSSLLVSRRLCFPQCLATPDPAVGRCAMQQAAICYTPMKASGQGAMGRCQWPGLCLLAWGLSLMAVSKLWGVQSCSFSPRAPHGSFSACLSLLSLPSFPPWVLSLFCQLSMATAEQLLQGLYLLASSTVEQVLRWELDIDHR